MSETYVSREDHRKPELYEIRMKGHLDARWADRFEGLSFTFESDGTTILTGPVIDQAQLHGLLRRVRDLGLPLVSVKPMNKNRQASVTASKLIRWAGLPAMVAGFLFVFVQMIHPIEIVSSVTTDRWAIVHYLTMAMALLGMLGVTGIYARQVAQAGWLGLIGYLLVSLWLALTTAFTFVEAFILPLLATEAPRFVESVLGIFTGHSGEFNLGGLAAIGPVSGVLYMLGGLLFGIATLRAGILPRWAAGLLGFGAVASLAAAVLPHGLARLLAVPVGLGLAWLGYALWSERRLTT